MKPYKFVVIGGDRRQLFLADYLKKNFYDVKLYGFTDTGVKVPVIDEKSAPKALLEASVKVFPLPFTKDGSAVNAPFSTFPIDIKSVIGGLKFGDMVFGGLIPKDIRQQIAEKGIICSDYFESKSLQIYNAIPTAEGIVKILIESLPTTIHGMECAVLGFGKTGKAIASALHALGADVTVLARSRENLAEAASACCRTRTLDSLSIEPVYFDAMVNTVPSHILGEKQLNNLNTGCLLIEIASSPFGIDFDAARTLGFNVVKAPSLPGTVAPKTAGEIIGETILGELGGVVL